jgi:hypothetical protein
LGVLFTGTALLAAAFFLHVLIWRVHRPSRQIPSLLAWFVVFFVLAVSVLAWLGWRLTSWEFATVSLFYGALAVAYVVLYSAIEEDSPSMSLVRDIAVAGPGGRTREELNEVLGRSQIVERRISAMLRDGMVVSDGDRLRLSPKGDRVARILALAAAVMNLDLGG